jgi:hypothetical protein
MKSIVLYLKYIKSCIFLNNIEEESLKFYIFTSNELYYNIDKIANIQDVLKREFNINRIKTC